MSKNANKGMEVILKRMLTTLDRKVDPSHTALIVIDVQNEFLEGGVFDKEGKNISLMQAMVPRLVSFIGEARKAGVTIIYTRSIWGSEDSRYLSDVCVEQQTRDSKGRFIEYPVCREGTWGADFYEGIKPLPGEVVVTKHRFSCFTDTNLDLILRSRGVRTLVMTGITANVCVETSARDGFCRDYYIVLLRDCTAAPSEELYKNTLVNIDRHFGQVVDVSDVLKCWQKSSPLKDT